MIVNFVSFQIGWWVSVLGAARQSSWIGVLVVGVVVAIHLATRGTPKESILVAAAAFLGLVLDSALLQSGLLTYRSQSPFGGLAPVWIVAMWVNFAITLRHSLAWLGSKRILSVVMGAIFGPLSYWGASRLEAIELVELMPALAALAVVWGVSLPMLYRVSEAYR